MCNSYESRFNVTELVDVFGAHGLDVVVPATVPTADRSTRPTDVAPIVRAIEGGVELAELRWGLRSPKVKGPVTNWRAEGRTFREGRCLIPAAAFHEWTGTRSPRTRWRFTVTGEDWFCIAGIWRSTPDGEPRFAMITIEPGPDVAPYHDRQPAILPRPRWRRWLATEPVPAEWLEPPAAATITVAKAAAGRDDAQLRLL